MIHDAQARTEDIGTRRTWKMSTTINSTSASLNAAFVCWGKDELVSQLRAILPRKMYQEGPRGGEVDLHHAFLQTVGRTQETWRVREHDLKVRAHHDPHDAMSGRLRLRRDDREFVPNELIHESGLLRHDKPTGQEGFCE